ncbi:MAG: hypothetical protein EHM36_10490 [Deltaproteobacteria bacterium]|nr:MAG: hypothetical protein EHM36_10490 [Deltaproteobacteria bacterium]
MELAGDQAYSLASGSVNQLSVQKKGSMDVQPVHVETVEISPMMCCFEWEGDQELLAGDEIDFQFDLEDFSLTTKGAIVRVDKCAFLDEGYEQRISSSYCAQFDGELDRNFFKRIAGTPRICKSIF